MLGSVEEIAKRKKEFPDEEISRQIKIMEKELVRKRNIEFISSTQEKDGTFINVLRAIVP